MPDGTAACRPPGGDHALWSVTRLALWPVMRIALRTRVTGAHHVPRRGPALVVCNHVSIADPPVLLMALASRRRVWTMSKAELFRVPALAGWMRRCGAFPVERGTADRRALRTARDLLAQGECVLVFGEGGVTRSGLLRPGLPGMGHLALGDGVTVVPAVVWNTQLGFGGSGSEIRRLGDAPALRGPVRVRFGAPVRLDDLRTGRRAGRNQAAADRVMDAVAALLPLVGGPAQPGPRPPARR